MTMDKTREAEVWQRVAEGPRSAPGPEGLLGESAALGAIYRRLAGSLTGPGRSLARKLLAEEEALAACLRGIQVLSGGGGERLRHWEPGKENTRKLLQGCYHRTRRCQGEYAARSLDPDFGEVYRSLAERAGKQCVRLAELLGNLV